MGDDCAPQLCVEVLQQGFVAVARDNPMLFVTTLDNTVLARAVKATADRA